VHSTLTFDQIGVNMAGKEQQNDKQDKKEQQKQDGIKKEQSAESMKTRCKICFKETSPNPKCFGHGGGGGGETANKK
jgi:hypothetical protein